MSDFFGDVFKFEKFNLKDMLKKVEKDPWRLLVGAGDPLSTEMWNGITGKDMEPLVDQMGGAYGGDWIGAFGKGQDKGVYGRAEAAGVPTTAGGDMHNLAHVISSMYANNWMQGQGFSMPNLNAQAPQGGGGTLQPNTPSLVAPPLPQPKKPGEPEDPTLDMYAQMLGKYPRAGLAF